jgi:murein DD-endopeptidase MepM/ murein hydrolase activator NlpD
MLGLFLTMNSKVYAQLVAEWGNAIYVDMAINEEFPYLGKTISLVGCKNNYCTVEVDRTQEDLIVARRALPTEINGVRVSVAMNKNVKKLTSLLDRELGLCKKDALLCLSDPSLPLLNSEQFTFPISRQDGYVWSMEAGSHMFSYSASYANGSYRPKTHKGLDFNLHEARGKKIHALVAIESGTVNWIEKDKGGTGKEGCICIQSASHPEIYYLYKHVNDEYINVSAGTKVEKGQQLAYIWGDDTWGHLHLGIVRRDEVPSYNRRYINLLNYFPQMYELWEGSLALRSRKWEIGDFKFGSTNDLNQGRKYAAGYDDVIGYGWKLGDWCVGNRVLWSRDNSLANCWMSKTLYAGTAAEATNPSDYYDFEILVENGTYMVQAEIGDLASPSWQKVVFEGVDAGTYDLRKGELKWTSNHQVIVNDNKLTIRLYLKDRQTIVGISELKFSSMARVNDRKTQSVFPSTYSLDQNLPVETKKMLLQR